MADCPRSASTCTCRSSRATTRSSGGWAASTRSSTTSSGSTRIRDGGPGIAITHRLIVGFCGETETQFEATLELLGRSATTRSSRPRFRTGRALRPRSSPTTCPPTSSGGGSTRCSPSRSRSASSATGPGWTGRSRCSSSRSGRRERTSTTRRSDANGPDSVLAGRTREQQARPPRGAPDLVGRLVHVADRARRTVRAPRRAPTDRRRDRELRLSSSSPGRRRRARPGCRSGSEDALRADGIERPRSWRLHHARSIAGSTSARRRSSLAIKGPEVPASRPRPRGDRTSHSSVAESSMTPVERARRDRRAGRIRRSSSVAPGSTCARSRAGSRPRGAAERTRRSGQRLEEELARGRRTRCWPLRLTATCPVTCSGGRPARIHVGSSGRSRSQTLQGDSPRYPAPPRLPRPGRLDRSWGWTRPAQREWIVHASARASSPPASLDEARRAARAVRSRSPGVQRDRLPRGVGRCSTVG